jgi:hypothetical protein
MIFRLRSFERNRERYDTDKHEDHACDYHRLPDRSARRIIAAVEQWYQASAEQDYRQHRTSKPYPEQAAAGLWGLFIHPAILVRCLGSAADLRGGLVLSQRCWSKYHSSDAMTKGHATSLPLTVLTGAFLYPPRTSASGYRRWTRSTSSRSDAVNGRSP